MMIRNIHDVRCHNLKSGTVDLINSTAQYGLEMRHDKLFDQMVCVKYQPTITQIQNTKRTDSSDV